MSHSAEELECLRILKDHGAIVVRKRKHKIWRFADGRIFVSPQTPSDKLAWKNQLTSLRRFLGLIPEGRGQPGERREKHISSAKKTPAITITTESPREQRADMATQLAEWRDRG